MVADREAGRLQLARRESVGIISPANWRFVIGLSELGATSVDNTWAQHALPRYPRERDQAGSC